MDTVIFNVRCPHCDRPLRAEVTGFCRTGLNSRWKVCKHCRGEYTVIFVAEAVKGSEYSDLSMVSLKDKVKYLKMQKMRERLELEEEIEELWKP